MSLDDYLKIGEPVTLGTHTFGAEEIKAFARKYDPQPFHVDEEAARRSVFGRLCASGWHSCSMWMKYNIAHSGGRLGGGPWHGEGPEPELGPSPGFSKLRWLKPVYAGDAITFKRTALKHRPVASRPGWRLLTILCEAENADGARVLEFESAVLMKAEAAT